MQELKVVIDDFIRCYNYERPQNGLVSKSALGLFLSCSFLLDIALLFIMEKIELKISYIYNILIHY